MNQSVTTQLHNDICELGAADLAHVSGGMMKVTDDPHGAGDRPAGQLVSVIGYRTFADVGL